MEHYAELLATLAGQEQALQFAAFSNDTALALGLSLVESAKRQGKIVTVSISRNGQVLFHHAMTGATPDQADWIRRKNNVVQRFGWSSYRVGIDHKHRGVAFDAIPYLDSKDYAAHGGAFPITIQDVGLVGTITVSGLPQAEDHALVVEAIRAFIA